MTNNNQPLKGLQGETVEQAAKNTLKIAGVFEQDVPGFIFGFKHGANWQSQHPTEKESATVDEMAERFDQMIREKDSPYQHIANESQFDHERVDISMTDIVDLMQAAYNMRDKEQAGAVEVIKASIEEAEYNCGIETGKDLLYATIRLNTLTTLLAQLTK